MKNENMPVEEENRLRQKRNMLIGLALLAVAVIGGIALVLWSVYGGQGTVKGMLTKYYEAMYTEEKGGFDTLVECLAPEIREDYYAQRTSGGTDFSALSTWRTEAIETVGENVTISVEVQETQEGTKKMLAAVQETCTDAEALQGVVFVLMVKGDRGYVKLSGLAECVREGSDWFLSTDTVDLKVTERVVDGQEG